MKSFSLLLLLLFSLHLTISAQDLPAASRIDLLLIHGNYEKAADTCKLILAADSLNPGIHYRMGLAYQNMLEDDLALSSFRRATRLDPDNPVFSYMFARGLYSRGKFSSALPLFEKLYSADTLNWMYAYYLTSIYMQNKRFDDAVSIYKRFLRKNPENYIYLDKLAFAYLKKENYSDAIDLYNKSLSINNKNTTAIKNLAVLYVATLRADTALQLLTKGIEIDPSDMDLYLRRANLNYLKNYKKRALDDYLVLLASGDSSTIYYKRIGIGYCYNLQPGKSISYLLEAFKKDSTDIETCNYLGQSYYKLKDMQSSINYYKKGIKILSPFYFQLRYSYTQCAEVQKASSSYADAIDSYIKAQNIFYDPTTDMTIANLYDDKLNNREESIYYYQKFLDNSKKSRMYFTGQYMEAVQKRLEYLKQDPEK